MTVDDIKALILPQSIARYNVKYRGLMDTLSITPAIGPIGSRTKTSGPPYGSVSLTSGPIARITSAGILVPAEGQNGRDMLDALDNIQRSNAWDDDPLAVWG
jgi:hypothetical protein